MDPSDQGVQQTNYTVVPRSLIFITKDEYILLLKGAPTKRLWANKYNGIGGHIESGENPLQSAYRELIEETGLSATQLELRAIIHITLPHSPGVMLFVFIGESTTFNLNSSAEGSPEWVPKSEYLKLELVEDLYELIPRILETGPLIYGTYVVDSEGLHVNLSTDSTALAHKELPDD